jgi:hypothetical protein
MTRSDVRARQIHVAEDSSRDCEGICGDRRWVGLFIRGGLGGDVSGSRCAPGYSLPLFSSTEKYQGLANLSKLSTN